jgi:adenylate cyclase
MDGLDAAKLDELATWLIEGTSDEGPERLFAEIAAQLAAAGLPLQRMAGSLHTANPAMRALQLIWTRGELQIHARDHGVTTSAIYVGTPVQRIIDGELDEFRCRLDVSREQLAHAVLAELSERGFTDYLVYPLVSTGALPAAAGEQFWRRQWISFATDLPRGFLEDEVAALRRLLPVISLRWAHEASKHAGRSLLRAYLGQNASRRILAGAFHRGSSQAIQAVIWYCDMRGFTALSDAIPAAEVVRILDAYFDCVASPIDEHGGEVLKFIGDAVLGIFPIEEASAEEPCRRALAAMQDARANLARLNAERAARGEVTLGLGIALHAGEVMYGNIGARNRLDFTVIGRPVNEVCRVEALTRVLGVDVLLTATFVRLAGLEGAVSLGKHALKGVAEAQEVFAPPP